VQNFARARSARTAFIRFTLSGRRDAARIPRFRGSYLPDAGNGAPDAVAINFHSEMRIDNNTGRNVPSSRGGIRMRCKLEQAEFLERVTIARGTFSTNERAHARCWPRLAGDYVGRLIIFHEIMQPACAAGLITSYLIYPTLLIFNARHTHTRALPRESFYF